MAFLSAFLPIGRGLLGAIIGLLIGAAFATLISQVTGHDPAQVKIPALAFLTPSAEIGIAISYVFALFGWLLGVGLWGV